MKRLYPLIVLLATIALVAGILLSKMSFLARTSMNIFAKKYQYYAFMKVWWQGALVVFGALMLLLFVQNLLNKKLSARKAVWCHVAGLLLAALGLYFTYNDFRQDLSHRWAGERLHLGFYLFWLGWMAISVFFLVKKKKINLKDLSKMDTSAV